ncbi:MAG: hypothetical protein QXU32_11915 [Nitrososphaerales archaeon]
MRSTAAIAAVTIFTGFMVVNRFRSLGTVKISFRVFVILLAAVLVQALHMVEHAAKLSALY